MKTAQRSTQIGSLAAAALLFVAVSYLAHRYQHELAFAIGNGGAAGVFGFIFLTALFVVFVIPLDIVLLIPVGSSVWGPVPTACMSIAGWTLGASAAFGIARLFGAPAVRSMIGLERMRAVERRMPRRNLFWTVVFFRMLVSVDVMSYALGLFSGISWSEYVLATALGVAPFGFYFAYAGALPFWYQLCAMALAFALATAVIVRYGIEREP